VKPSSKILLIRLFSLISAFSFFYWQGKNLFHIQDSFWQSVFGWVLLLISFLLYKILVWSLKNITKDKRTKDIQEQDPIE